MPPFRSWKSTPGNPYLHHWQKLNPVRIGDRSKKQKFKTAGLPGDDSIREHANLIKSRSQRPL